eukprot:m.1197776 g.1197776  ORF g.1197776 m.1197776 type:complete len:115 (+) comp24568_c2_seq6:249-593(+)
MYAVNMFYVQGSDTMADVDAFLKRTSKDMSAAADALKQHKHNMEVKHADAQMALMARPSLGCPAGCDAITEGYLFRREHNTFRSWTRRWLCIKVSLACLSLACDLPSFYCSPHR